jgi:hypothetical protein
MSEELRKNSAIMGVFEQETVIGSDKEEGCDKISPFPG